MSDGLNFFALPDDRRLNVVIAPNGQLEFRRANLLVFPQVVLDHLDQHARTLWHPAPLPNGSGQPRWIINNCTDPDMYTQAMGWLQERFDANTPIFNHPAALYRTARDRQSQQLAGIEGLTVPKAVRFTFETADDLRKVFDEEGFSFPVLVRPNTYQTGVGLQRINSHKDWDRLLYSRFFRREHMMIQFLETRTVEGFYQKARVMFIGGAPYVRHIKASSQWLIHNELNEQIGGYPEREMEMIAKLEAHEGFMAICAQIAERTRLDFFGADVGFDLSDDRFVLFEANPSMSVFFSPRSGVSPQAAARRAQLQDAPAQRLLTLIRDPSKWAESPAG